jgi:hypothetical protein
MCRVRARAAPSVVCHPGGMNFNRKVMIGTTGRVAPARQSAWFILDGTRQRSTGFGANEITKAEKALADIWPTRIPYTFFTRVIYCFCTSYSFVASFDRGYRSGNR